MVNQWEISFRARIMSRCISVFSAVACAFLLISCASSKDAINPSISLPANYSDQASAKAGSVNVIAWWRHFNDPRLSALVEKSLTANIDVRRAAVEVLAADAGAVAAGAASLPSVNVGASADILRKDTGDSTVDRQVGASSSLSWAIDLFGRYSAARDAAIANRDALVADIDVARLAVVFELASSYIDAAYYRARAASISASVASLRRTLDLSTEMRKAGTASEVDLVQVRSRLADAGIDLPAADAAATRAVNRIATLTDMPAGTVKLAGSLGQPVPVGPTGAGVPAELLRNRPDIRRQEQRIVAAAAELDVAGADLYPSLTLSGTISAARLISGLSAPAAAWSFGPTLDLPIFDGGRRKANVEIARSRLAAQQLAWRKAVLAAVEDVEGALADLSAARRKSATAGEAVAAARLRLDMVRESYQGGTLTLLDVLDAERGLSLSRLSQIDARRELAIAFVRLNVALGWQPVPTAAGPGATAAPAQACPKECKAKKGTGKS